MDNEMPRSEREEADVIEHRHIDQHDAMVTVTTQQVIMAHNRSLDASCTEDSQAEARIIARLLKLYVALLNS